VNIADSCQITALTGRVGVSADRKGHLKKTELNVNIIDIYFFNVYNTV